MVNPAEFLALDPEVEDLLSMWGKDVTEHNVEHYFGPFELPSLEALSQVENQQFLSHGKESGHGVHISGSEGASTPAAKAIVPGGANVGGLSTDPKGKSLFGRFIAHKGLENISHLGLSAGKVHSRAQGGITTLSRASLPRDPQNHIDIAARDPGVSTVGGLAVSDGQGSDFFPSGNDESGSLGRSRLSRRQIPFWARHS